MKLAFLKNVLEQAERDLDTQCHGRIHEAFFSHAREVLHHRRNLNVAAELLWSGFNAF